jgi:hypothetical protein
MGKIQFWKPPLNLLAILLSRFASLDVLAVDGLGHHVLLIATPTITFMVVSERRCVLKHSSHS